MSKPEAPAIRQRFRERVPALAGWLLLGLVILLVMIVRVRLRDMPLERDEGEYACVGQLLLQGIPPYQSAYNMKLPGTYAAYAAIMAVFGQSASAIRLGVMLVNAASILLVFFLGWRLMDEWGAGVAAASFGLMSLNPGIMGLAGHATHFVTLAALAGLVTLVPACERRRRFPCFLSGLFFGLAFLMKQPGVFFGMFGLGCLLRATWRVRRTGGSDLWWPLIAYASGCALPYLLTLCWLWPAGALPNFLFWTHTYAAYYGSMIGLSAAPGYLGDALRTLAGPYTVLWVLPGIGLSLLLTTRPSPVPRLLPVWLLGCSLAAVSAGFYYREHYFIQLLPALAWLTGAAAITALRWTRFQAASGPVSDAILLRRLAGVGVLFLLAAGLSVPLANNARLWFALSPAEATWEVYGSTLFVQTRSAADFVRTNSSAQGPIAVVGSEPQIYFYAQRPQATGYLYTYALMEPHPFAARMQAQMIREIVAARPEYVVMVNDPDSWLARAGSDLSIFEWWKGYAATNLVLAASLPIEDTAQQTLAAGAPPPQKNLLVYIQRGPGDEAPPPPDAKRP